MAESIRLSKRLIQLTSCSRREAEIFIEGGWVRVDGRVVEEPQFMVSHQHVELHPDATATPLAPATILYHQPPGATLDLRQISTNNRSDIDMSGIELRRKHFSRLTPCVPLEGHASGLIVLTQDPGVTRKLVEDAATVEQEYIVEVEGTLSPEELKRLNHGLIFNGRALAPIKASWQNETKLRFALKGPRPGQIKFMCESVGLNVIAMKRIRLGAVSMAKLPVEQWRFLSAKERF